MENKCLLYIKGFLKINIKGDYVERFFNMCRAHNIFIWNIKNNKDGYSCYIYYSDFKDIIPLLKKTGTRIHVAEKKGLPFNVPRLMKKIIYIMGVIICVAMLYNVTNYVWAIEYIGNFKISDDQLSDFIKEENIYFGTKKNSINCEEEEKKLRARFDDVTWTSIYFEGTKLCVEIKENDTKTNKENNNNGCNIVANEEGVVTAIITRNGIPQVKVGDTIAKGDILVKGQVPIYDESGNIINYHIYKADADIYINTNIVYNEKIDKMYSKIWYTGKKNEKMYLEIPGYRINSFFSSHYDMEEIITQKRQLKLFASIFLPVFYGKIVSKEYYLEYMEYTKEDMQAILMDNLETFILCLQEKGVQIIEKNVKISKNSEGMEINSEISLIKPTGVINEISEEIQ